MEAASTDDVLSGALSEAVVFERVRRLTFSRAAISIVATFMSTGVLAGVNPQRASIIPAEIPRTLAHAVYFDAVTTVCSTLPGSEVSQRNRGGECIGIQD